MRRAPGVPGTVDVYGIGAASGCNPAACACDAPRASGGTGPIGFFLLDDLIVLVVGVISAGAIAVSVPFGAAGFVGSLLAEASVQGAMALATTSAFYLGGLDVANIVRGGGGAALSGKITEGLDLAKAKGQGALTEAYGSVRAKVREVAAITPGLGLMPGETGFRSDDEEQKLDDWSAWITFQLAQTTAYFATTLPRPDFMDPGLPLWWSLRDDGHRGVSNSTAWLMDAIRANVGAVSPIALRDAQLYAATDQEITQALGMPAGRWFQAYWRAASAAIDTTGSAQATVFDKALRPYTTAPVAPSGPVDVYGSGSVTSTAGQTTGTTGAKAKRAYMPEAAPAPAPVDTGDPYRQSYGSGLDTAAGAAAAAPSLSISPLSICDALYGTPWYAPGQCDTLRAERDAALAQQKRTAFIFAKAAASTAKTHVASHPARVGAWALLGLG